mmetsp:Transcript_30331/g.34452  ORF Transcript_30331/g.34452 Transcript_30331/m.34452 type:complete len:967 (+) Transcript_30331:157-3057(+)
MKKNTSFEVSQAMLARREEEADREAKKTKISKILTNNPCACVCISLLIIAFCVVLSALTFTASEFSDRQYYVWGDLRVQREDVLNEAVDDVREEELGSKELPLQIEEQRDWNLYIVYHAKSGNSVITLDNLKIFNKVHQVVQGNRDYGKVCLFQSADDPTCTPVKSFTDWFTTATTELEVTEIMQQKATADFDSNKIFFGKSYTPTNPYTKWARSYYQFGLPIKDGDKRYRSSTDDFEAQEQFFTDFLADIEPDITDLGSSGLEIYIFSGPWWDYVFGTMMMADFLFVFGSVLFVWFYMMIHTWSVLLPALGMFQVISAFPIAYTLYRVVMRIKLFNMMNFFSLFIILGIAADDIFVFVDAWKQSAQLQCLQGDLEKRVAYVYRRAVKAMFVTTITTFCAFLATAISEIAPISAFGIFSANMILSNYLLVITFFPCCVIMRHKFFVWWSKRKTRKPDGQALESEMVATNRTGPQNYAGAPREDIKHGSDIYPEVESDKGEADEQLPVTTNAVPASAKVEKESKIEKFFEGPYIGFILKARYIILGIFFVWSIAAIVLATQISPLSENEQFFKDDHDIPIVTKALRNDFHTGEDDGELVVKLVYGIDGLDRSDVVPYDVESIGEVEWDDNFNLAPTQNQSRLVEICAQLKDFNQTQDGITNCFIEDFKSWIIDTKNETFPVPEAEFNTKMKEFLAGAGNEHSVQGRVGYVGNDLRYVFVQAVALGEWSPYKVMHPRWRKWEDFMDSLNANSPAGLNNGFQTSDMWQWMITERALLRNAFQGMAIAGSIALVVLIMSTLNWVLAFYSVFVIAGIVISVLAVVFMLGWEFGMTVSISVVILIGFSVDYAVHICHAYVESEEETRLEKTRESLRKMGVSILGGAITTFGTGVVLFATSLLFFNRFAWIISSTIVFATAWSMVFFPALLMTVGPTDTTGNLKAYYQQFKEKRAERQEAAKSKDPEVGSDNK